MCKLVKCPSPKNDQTSCFGHLLLAILSIHRLPRSPSCYHSFTYVLMSSCRNTTTQVVQGFPVLLHPFCHYRRLPFLLYCCCCCDSLLLLLFVLSGFKRERERERERESLTLSCCELSAFVCFCLLLLLCDLAPSFVAGVVVCLFEFVLLDSFLFCLPSFRLLFVSSFWQDWQWAARSMCDVVRKDSFVGLAFRLFCLFAFLLPLPHYHFYQFLFIVFGFDKSCWSQHAIGDDAKLLCWHCLVAFVGRLLSRSLTREENPDSVCKKKKGEKMRSHDDDRGRKKLRLGITRRRRVLIEPG